ncbi:Ldh family oxidoreductase [Azospirillum sp. ST 5-10]|uniref:Ldh family oxidoreductase n=1 Tax=unclassified Azospirillum TaxID=2630922 RepID=UPI003F4A4999
MDTTLVPAERLHRQLVAVLRAWGMPASDAGETADVLLEADLRGIDSHGFALLPLYDELRRSGRLVMAAEVRVVRDGAATGLIDGGGGLGAVPSLRAMDLAAAKARTFGLGAVAVRNSNHHGAAGVYALRAAGQGLIGVATTAVHRPAIVPTFGTRPMLGTNPIAFAAPAGRNPPFLLDMATSTAAVGKLKLAARAGTALPEGWALTPDGRSQSDPDRALADKLLTPLGGSRELGGHKGYGLAAMVEVLSTVLAGASFAPLRPDGAARNDVGHFFLALDPHAFRDDGGFEADLDAVVEALRATAPVDPARPVLVAGDPEHRTRERRLREGVPVPRSLADTVGAIARAAGAEDLLARPAA